MIPGTATLATTGLAVPEFADRVGPVVVGLVGLLGGAHCLGMCGPLVTADADRNDHAATHRVDRPVIRQHLLFNLGRTASYALLGAASGALGLVVFDAATGLAVAAGVRGVAGGVGVVLVTGLGNLLRGRGTGGETVPGLDGLFGRVSGRLTGRIDTWFGARESSGSRPSRRCLHTGRSSAPSAPASGPGSTGSSGSSF